MIIKIEALDTLFFKDGKPFSMGEESWADGIFPPPPSVICGALRTAWFAQNPEEFNKANSADDPTNSLMIKGIYFEYGNEIYFPLPLDLVKKKNEKDLKSYPLNKSKEINLSNSSAPDNNLTSGFDDEIESIDGGIIPLGSFERYLNSAETQFYYKSLSDIVLSEPKVGIGRENQTRTSSEGKLYRVGMRRLEETRKFMSQPNKIFLVIEYEGITLADSGFIKLGAEGKIAAFHKYDKIISLNNKNKSSGNNEKKSDTIFKFYLLTPAIFEDGWKPNLTKNAILKDLKLDFITACIGKPVNIGGFDMQKKTPKTMYKAVPPGSVFYFKTSKPFDEVFNALNGKSISEIKTDKEGYGIGFVGEVKW